MQDENDNKIKPNNYDYTASKRMSNREARIRDAKLSHLKVVMHKDDAKEVRSYAKTLYKKRGIIFDE